MGRKYAVDIDHLIFENLISTEERSVSYSSLYGSVRAARDELSYETFDTHIDILQQKNLIGKSPDGYYLKDNAKRLLLLGILELGCKNQTFLEPLPSTEQLRLKQYFILLYYACRQNKRHQLKNKEDYEAFLKKNHITEESLGVPCISYVNNKWASGHVKEFFPRQKGVRIQIFEGFSRQKEDEAMEYSITYSYHLIGFSVTEIMQDRERPAFGNVILTCPEIQEATNLLIEAGILKKIAFIDNEIRYDVYDPALHRVVFECWQLYDDVLLALTGIWDDIRRPMPEEVKWLELLYGNEPENSKKLRTILIGMHYNRLSNKKKKDHESRVKNTKQFMQYIHQDFEELLKLCGTAIREYDYLVEKLLEYIFPSFMRPLFEFSGSYDEGIIESSHND